MVTALAANAVFAAGSFTDVSEGDDFYENIESLYEQGIIGGFADGTFRPGDYLTRQQAAKMIALGANYGDHDGTGSKLVDVADLTWGQENIWALEAAGVVKGFGTSKEFRPRLNITRGHVAKMIALAFGLEEGDVEVDLIDLPADEEVADAIRILASNGIVSGFGKSKEFRPDALVTRGQFAKMVDLAMEAVQLKVVSVSAINGSQIQVKFNAAADKTSAETAANVVVKGVATTADPAIDTRSLSKDGKTLTLTANAGLDGKYSVEILNTGGTKVLSKENPTKSFEGKVEILNIKDTVAPAVTGVEYEYSTGTLGTVEATVKFSEPLKKFGTVSLDGVTLTSGTDYTAYAAGADKLVLLGLEPGKTHSLSIVGAQDNANNYISPNPAVVNLNVPKDTVKPSVAITAENTTITLEFSEKINTSAGTLTVAGTTVNLSTLTLVPNTNKYTYDASSLVTGFLNTSVKVSAYKDLAGNVGDDVTKSLLLSKETTAPKYVSALNKANVVAVKFDEEVREKTITSVDVKYTSKDNLVKSVAGAVVTAADGYDANGDTVITGDEVNYIALTFTLGTSGTTAILNADKTAILPGTYEITLAIGAVEDVIGNANAKAIKFTVEVVTETAETDAVVEVHATDTKQVLGVPGAIEVIYNKEMGASALNYTNYKLAGVTIPSTSELYFDGAKTKVRINLPEEYITVAGERLLEVSNVIDKDGNTLKTGKTSAEVDLLEMVKPLATKVELMDAQNLKVTFSEKLAALGTVTGVTVKVNGTKIDLDSTTPFNLETGDKTVTIKASSLTAFKLTDTITVEFEDASIKDIAGNKVKNVTLTK